MKVKKLEVVAKDAPNPKIVEFLREALKDAKAGRVQGIGIALAVISDDESSDSGRATETIMTYTPGWAAVTGMAIQGMAFRILFERYSNGMPLPSPKLDDTDE